MPNKYPKTENLFKRDNSTHRLTDKMRWEEFDIIGSWIVTEKIDGTNIRISLAKCQHPDAIDDEHPDICKNATEPCDSGSPGCIHCNEFEVLIQGRGDNAQIPPTLLKYLQETFTLNIMKDVCEGDEIYPFTLYGEGYGAGIQKGGNLYRSDPSFRVFDVLVGEKWLNFENIEDIADKLAIKTVPIISMGMNIDEIVSYVMSDPISQVAREEYEGTETEDILRKQEGIVAFTNPTLFTWFGQRVKFKLKKVDFPDEK